MKERKQKLQHFFTFACKRLAGETNRLDGEKASFRIPCLYSLC